MFIERLNELGLPYAPVAASHAVLVDADATTHLPDPGADRVTRCGNDTSPMRVAARYMVEDHGWCAVCLDEAGVRPGVAGAGVVAHRALTEYQLLVELADEIATFPTGTLSVRQALRLHRLAGLDTADPDEFRSVARLPLARVTDDETLAEAARVIGRAARQRANEPATAAAVRHALLTDAAARVAARQVRARLAVADGTGGVPVATIALVSAWVDTRSTGARFDVATWRASRQAATPDPSGGELELIATTLEDAHDAAMTNDAARVVAALGPKRHDSLTLLFERAAALGGVLAAVPERRPSAFAVRCPAVLAAAFVPPDDPGAVVLPAADAEVARTAVGLRQAGVTGSDEELLAIARAVVA